MKIYQRLLLCCVPLVGAFALLFLVTLPAPAAPTATPIDFETPVLGPLGSQIVNPYTDASGIQFNAELIGLEDEVVGVVKNSVTSACVDPADANQKLGTGRSTFGDASVGTAGIGIRATFPKNLQVPGVVSVEFQTSEGQPVRLRLFDASGAEIASVTETATPAAGNCGKPGGQRARKLVTATATQPVAYVIMDMAEQTSGFVFVIDNFLFEPTPNNCQEIFSPRQIPAAGLINFDDLSNATVIGNHYQPAFGVTFENDALKQAIIYADNPSEVTESHSKPNVAMNFSIHPNTSSNTPMRITFDSPKTHVGLYMGNGEIVSPTATFLAFDAAGKLLCRAINGPVPEDVNEFIGLYDPAGRISSVTLDYGETTLSETIDDLFFVPNGAPPTATPTATSTNTPTSTPTTTATPTNTPTSTPTSSPTPTATSIVANPEILAMPYFPVEPVLAIPDILKPDVAIHGIELTQGIQCFDPSSGLAGCADNSLPLVLKKDTTARIYLKYNGPLNGGSLNNVPVRLFIRANGVDYLASASGKATTAINQANSDSADIYFNVNFSNDMPVEFYAIVDPDNAISETDESNNRYPSSGAITLTFRKRDTLKIVGQRTRYHPSGYSGGQYAGGWAVNGGAADFFEQLLPLRNNGINYSVKSGYLDWTKTLTPCSSDTGSANQHSLIQTLNMMWLMQNTYRWLFGTGAFTNADHVYGWVDDDGYPCGHADMPVYPHAGGLGVVGIGTDAPGTNTDTPGAGAFIFAHELLHDYDLKHTDTGADDCGSNDSSSAFPYGSSSIQEFGFNPITGKIYNPSNTHDVMSYCPAGGSRQGWISPYTWGYMSNKLDAAAVSAASDGRLMRLGKENFLRTAATKLLVVNAAIYNPAAPDFNQQQPGTLYNLHLVENDQPGATYLLPGEGYAVQLRQGETILYTEDFSVTFASEYSGHTGHDGHGGHGDEDEPPFATGEMAQADASMILPWMDGATTVVLLKGDQVLAAQQVSGNKPSVAFTSPTTATTWSAGTTELVTWSGNDADSDPLTYSLFYRHGAGEWELLATELVTPSYAVEVDLFAGGSEAHFRVVANDGINTAYGESAAVTIPNKAPIVLIADPLNGATFTPGALVVMQGSALDVEDGRLDDALLKWSSDRQGDLGTGPSVPVNTLAPGEHTITLNVQDSNGVTANASVKIFVGHQTYLPTIMK